ncbi:MAG: S16 family serine protease [Actinomycetota bacterium]
MPTSRFRTMLAALWVVGVLAAAFLAGWVRLPYYAIGPGPAREVRPLITVEGAPVYDARGRFVMTTIEAEQLTAMGSLFAWIDPNLAVVDESVLYPPGLTAEEEERLAISDMDTSKIDATYVVLRELIDYPEERGTGALIRQVVPDCSADGALFPGDVVTAIDGRTVADPRAAGALIDAAGPGEALTFEVRALGTDVPERVRLVRERCGGSRDPIVGVSMVEVFPIDVEIRSGDVGGSSAGLMFAVALYDLMTPGDLAAGRTIAGTGTIVPSGRVGPIGGIEEKVVAADRSGAEALLVPADDFAAAQEVAPDGLQLVEIETFRGALDYLLETGGQARVEDAAA